MRLSNVHAFSISSSFFLVLQRTVDEVLLQRFSRRQAVREGHVRHVEQRLPGRVRGLAPFLCRDVHSNVLGPAVSPVRILCFSRFFGSSISRFCDHPGSSAQGQKETTQSRQGRP